MLEADEAISSNTDLVGQVKCGIPGTLVVLNNSYNANEE